MIDTKTRGIDLVGRFAVDLQEAGITRFTAGYNATGTHVTRVANTPTALAAQQAILFDRLEITRIEEGQPRRTLSLTMDNTTSRSTRPSTRPLSVKGAHAERRTLLLDQKYGANG